MGVNDEVQRLSTWFPANGQECVLTGWDSLDEIIGGLRNGEVIVVSCKTEHSDCCFRHLQDSWKQTEFKFTAILSKL